MRGDMKRRYFIEYPDNTKTNFTFGIYDYWTIFGPPGRPWRGLFWDYCEAFLTDMGRERE